MPWPASGSFDNQSSEKKHVWLPRPISPGRPFAGLPSGCRWRRRSCAAFSAASAWRPTCCTAKRPPASTPRPGSPADLRLSPLVGTPLTTSAKFAVVAKSPLTDRLNDALSSSHFALAAKRRLRRPGHRRRLRTPLASLVIDDGGVRLEPAGDLWGLPPTRPQLASAELRPGLLQRRSSARPARTWCATPPSATRTATPAAAASGRSWAPRSSRRWRWPGTARGGGRPGRRGRRRPSDLSQRSFGPATAKYRELGTVANLLTFNRFAALPTRNFQQGTFEEAEALSGEELNAARRVARQFLCRLHHRLRAHLRRRPDGRRGPPGVREPVRPGPAVRHRRPRRRPAGGPAVRPARPRHHLRRGHASPSRWSVPSAAC